jgi:iron complex transport system substrate-binding protein
LKTVRVVSLLASGTEIVCALGAGESLVGRSHECDSPGWVTKLPACTSPAFDVNESSGAIDAEVRRRLKTAEPLYHVDTDLIKSLNPDLVITQMHCDVCAVTPSDLKRADREASWKTLALRAGTVQGICDDIIAIGISLNLANAAERLVASINSRIEAVRNSVAHKPCQSVVVLEWTDPMFAMGNWGPELVQAANARLMLGEKGAFSRSISWDDVRDADPDFLIVAPCGFSLERTIREVPHLEALPGWFEFRAVRLGNVALADGNKYFNRSGVTIADTVEILAEIVHGRYAGYQPAAWRGYKELRTTTIIEQLHAAACANGLSHYADPTTGFQVFTADYLRAKGPCCGNDCRHCPYRGDSKSPRSARDSGHSIDL